MLIRALEWSVAGAVALVFSSGPAYAAMLDTQGTATGGQTRSSAQSQAGSATQSDDSLKIPTGDSWLGTVRIPTRVLADGKPLPAGTYRVRLTGRTAEPKAPGARHELERWIEFVQGGQVKGQALAPVVPADAVKTVADSPPPAPGQFAVQRLAGNDYLRLWYNMRGDHILIHLPVASTSAAVGTSGP